MTRPLEGSIATDFSKGLERLAARTARALVVVVGIIAAVASPARGQKLQFRQLNPEDGVSSSFVQIISKDARGFLWFGTDKGLDRYDGYALHNYRHQRADTNSIADDMILSILQDRRGTMWVGTNVGISRYDRDRDAFVNYSVAPLARQVRSIEEDSRGTLWVGADRGLYSFDRTRGVATPLGGAAGALLSGQTIQTLHQDRHGRLWIGTETRGLFVLDSARRTLTGYAHNAQDPNSLPDNDIRSLVEDSIGGLWIATWNGGLVKLNPRTNAITTYRHDSRDARSIAANRIVRLAPAGERGLWIGTEDAGLDYFNYASGIFTHHRDDPTDPTSLHGSSVWAVHQDEAGSVWVGTFTGGVNVSKPNSGAIQFYHTVAGDSGSLGLNTVRAFAESRRGSYWVATDGAGLDELDVATGKFTHYTSKNSHLNSNAVLDVVEDHQGTTWIGAWQGGISRFDRATRSFTAYTTKNTNLGDDNVFALHVDQAGELWVGTQTHGVYLFDRTRQTFIQKVNATRLRGSLPVSTKTSGTAVRILTASPDGRHLLIGTERSGLGDYDISTGTLTMHQGLAGDSASLTSNTVRAVLESSPGIVWVGTSTGLDQLDRRTNIVTHFGKKDGLPSDYVAGLAMDDSGQLWISTDRGIARFDPATKRVRRYTTSDGLQGREFNTHAYFRASDGSLFFGGNNGFNVIHPTRMIANNRKPPVVLTGFQLFNHDVPIGTKGSPLQKHIAQTKQLVLSYQQSVVTIEYAALDYMAPDKNQYAYRLEGLDRDWNQVGTQRVASYTNLPPGHYLFRVKASNNDGVWNEEGASLAITITPPFWETWWFRLLVTVVLSGMVLAIIRSAQTRHRRLQAMNEQLAHAAERDRESQQYLERNVLDILGAMQQFSAGDYSVALSVASEDAIGKLRLGFNSVVADRKRAEEELRQSQKMEAVGRLAGGVAHDFNNLLTVIKGNAELALSDLDSKEAVQEELEEIERASERASSLTRQLLAFSRKQILKPQILSLNEMIVEVGRMLRRTLGEDIELKIDLDPALGAVLADPGQIEQVMLNLAVNARDAMPRGGQLRIETKNVNAADVADIAEAESVPYVVIRVTDTGTGMAPTVRDRVFEPFFTTKEQGKGTGLGLSTVYGSVKQSGGFVLVESELGKGSSFSIYLPRTRTSNERRPIIESGTGPSGSATVLLVEDEDAVRRLASRVLIRAGYNVLTAACGEAALEVAAGYAGTIDLLMTDVVMPGMSGRELAEQLMPLHPGMRLLYASGYTEDAIIRHGVSSQETAFLEKPFAPNALLRKLRQVLEGAALTAVNGERF